MRAVSSEAPWSKKQETYKVHVAATSAHEDLVGATRALDKLAMDCADAHAACQCTKRKGVTRHEFCRPRAATCEWWVETLDVHRHDEARNDARDLDVERIVWVRHVVCYSPVALVKAC